MPRWRLFVALPVPEDTASSITSALTPYRAAFPDARWLRPDLLHVTVRFLGGTDPVAVPDLAHAIRSVASDAPRVELVTGHGAGDDGRLRATGVAWLTITHGAEMVRELCARLDPWVPLEALASSVLPAPPAAHVTVARGATRELISALRDQASGPTSVAWVADRMVLFRSNTGTPGGSTYEPLAEAPLGARAAA
jgi:2'-5' RNA ligase